MMSGRLRERRLGRSLPQTLGAPLPAFVIALVVAVSMGVLLSHALNAVTTTPSGVTSPAVGDNAIAAKNSSGQVVLGEMAVGAEVQRLVDSGAVPPQASFDTAACLQEQQITDRILIMEEVAWGPDQLHGWLIVHGPVDRETLMLTGGAVGATVVTEQCGRSTNTDADDSRLWSGSVLIGQQ